jgi:hypothetical protein
LSENWNFFENIFSPRRTKNRKEVHEEFLKWGKCCFNHKTKNSACETFSSYLLTSTKRPVGRLRRLPPGGNFTPVARLPRRAPRVFPCAGRAASQWRSGLPIRFWGKKNFRQNKERQNAEIKLRRKILNHFIPFLL